MLLAVALSFLYRLARRALALLRVHRMDLELPAPAPRRPSLPEETVELICLLARENPRWGYLRIVGELDSVLLRR